MKNKTMRLAFCLGVLVLAACSPAPTQSPVALPSAAPAQPGQTGGFDLSSPAFGPGAPIPTQYGCTGQNISPALNWSAPPSGTQSLALTLFDPDAPGGGFVHWVLFNIPATSHGLPEALARDPQLADGTLQGRNGAASNGYIGPCPPSGTHHYIFTLYALDTSLNQLSTDADSSQLLQATQGHILAQAELMGTFGR